MKRYNLLTKDDLIPNNHYEVISLFGKNPNPRSEVAFYDRYGYWCGIADNHTILEIIDNSVMLVLAKENPERYKEIVLGGSYDDGKYNDERCNSSYKDCEELYPVERQENIKAKAYDEVCNAISNLLSGDTKHLEGVAYYKELAYLEVLHIVEQLKEV